MKKYEETRISKTIQKVLLNPKTVYRCLVAGLISILTMIAFGTVVSIIRCEPWENVGACVENCFLTFVLSTIVIGYKKKGNKIIEKLMGELLAIYCVTNTTYFVEMLIEVINRNSTFLDYFYLSLEFLIMVSSFLVFNNHLDKGDDVKKEDRDRIVINVLLVIIIMISLFDVVAMIIYDDIKYILMFIDEYIYISFGMSLTIAVLSSESIRIQKEVK